MNTNISIIQLIKQGDIDVESEISKLRAGRNININIRVYLKHSSDYHKITEQIEKTKKKLQNADKQQNIYFANKLENLRKVKQDFIVNALLLAKTFSTMEIRTEKLKKAMQLFEQGKITEANKILDEAELYTDQANLIAFNEYLEQKQKFLLNELSKNNNFPEA